MTNDVSVLLYIYIYIYLSVYLVFAIKVQYLVFHSYSDVFPEQDTGS